MISNEFVCILLAASSINHEISRRNLIFKCEGITNFFGNEKRKSAYRRSMQTLTYVDN